MVCNFVVSLVGYLIAFVLFRWTVEEFNYGKFVPNVGKYVPSRVERNS